MTEIWRDSEAKKNFENVFNRETLLSLYDLADKGHFKVLYGIVKAGKESNICIAESKDGKKLAVKIYMVEASKFKRMRKYLMGDPRFRGIKNNRRSIIFNWCKKEFKNLKKARNATLDVPEPLAFKKNVLIMDFLGEEMNPAPRLKDVELENPEKGLEKIIESVKKLYRQEKLIHGDLSQYNILIWKGKIWIIDLSQGVLKSHPAAEELLERDVENILKYFRKNYNLKRDKNKILGEIKGEG